MTALQGVYLYTLEKFSQLLKIIGDEEYEKYCSLISEVRCASKKYLYDENTQAFVNDFDNER